MDQTIGYTAELIALVGMIGMLFGLSPAATLVVYRLVTGRSVRWHVLGALACAVHTGVYFVFLTGGRSPTTALLVFGASLLVWPLVFVVGTLALGGVQGQAAKVWRVVLPTAATVAWTYGAMLWLPDLPA